MLINLCIQGWAESTPSASALIFLEDGETETERISYRQLHQRAGSIAHCLKQRQLVGERVLLLFHSRIDYITAFLGCLYAGVIAVPVYPPRNNYHAQRVSAIAGDAQAKTVLTMQYLRPDIEAQMDRLSSDNPLEILAMDGAEMLSSGEWMNPALAPDQVAYLQYTSGSTGTPKGVMVRHGNLMHNCLHSAQTLGLPQGRNVVSWLPIFHDMGLVHGICMALTQGGAAVFMPSPVFVQKPLRWLQAIARYRAVYTPAPNFAYELCANRITPEEAAQLDLSCWQVAINGAEPISLATLTKFRKLFESSGFHPGTFSGGYGLAETTLMVTCGKNGEVTPVLYLDAEALRLGQVRVLPESDPKARPHVSSGWIVPDPGVRIVNPETGQECPASEVGEIWVSGSSNCGGYWCRHEETQETFAATLASTPGVTYIRTGDLGFAHESQLFVTGRVKDLIIIRGANHYPQDIERTAENAHPALRKGGWSAAFTLDDADDAPQLVVVLEVERTERKKVDATEAGLAIMQAVTEQHGIDVDLVVLIEPSGIPKTSSGKIQRRACKAQLLAAELNEIGRWQRFREAPASTPALSNNAPGRAALETMLRQRIARMSGIAADHIGVDQPFTSLGLNSIKVVEMITELGSALDMTLAPTIAFEYPTIEQLAAYLSGSLVPEGSDSPAEQDRRRFEAVAIIGMSCRLPGADSPQAFWELLKQGDSTVGEVPPDRAALTGFAARDTDAFRFGSFLSGIDSFDANLFGISPREAQSIDPQQRLLLETAWHALESANIAPDRLSGSSTGVFVGISSNDYFRLQRANGAGQDTYSGTGGALSIAANRISYTLGLQGPSLAIDTACSSSLVAVHTACRSLASNESTLALAGGVNLVLSTDYGNIFSQAQMLSPTGRCHTFGAAADGYVRGEGCGVVVLKLLRHAERDGDRILGVIRGSAVNQDGASNGLTAPNGQAQQQVIRNALRAARLSPAAIGYVETHGTGTPLGDPVEVSALQQVFAANADGEDKARPQQPCWLGAVKPNVGHLESAAGITGLIKALLVLQHGQIPPLAVGGELNPQIDLSASRVSIARQLQSWPEPADGQPRRAGVSSFGFGGTNAHVILEQRLPASVADESAAAAPAAEGERACLLALSANSRSSLRALAQRYAGLLQDTPQGGLATLCQATNTQRAQLPERLCLVGNTPAQLASSLSLYGAGDFAALPPGSHGRARQRQRIAFLFTGQGAQYAGMGRDLYQTEAVFHDYIERCETILSACLGRSLKAILFGVDGALLDDTRYAQPALVALELALAHLWRHYGVEPEFVCGHSVGEYAAACVAGILNLEDTLALVCERGRQMASAPGHGAMLSVHATEADLRQWLAASASTLEIAACNAPDQHVLSGALEEIDVALEKLNAAGMAATRLKVSHAFHSRLMQAASAGLRSALGKVVFHAPTLRMVATGASAAHNEGSAAALDHADYWSAQLLQPVRFSQAIERLAADGADTFVEIGPLPVLTKLGPKSFDGGNWVCSMVKDGNSQQHVQQALATLFVAGVPLHFDLPAPIPATRALALPLYAFEQNKYWFQAAPTALRANMGQAASFAGVKVAIAADDIHCFHTVLPADNSAYLEDHQLRSEAVMPGAGYISLMLSAAHSAAVAPQGSTLALREVNFFKPLKLGNGPLEVQTILQRRADAVWQARVLARVMARASEQAAWELYANAELQASDSTEALPAAAMTGTAQDVAAFYAHWAQQGLVYGPRFRAISSLQLDGGCAHAWLDLPALAGSTSDSVLHAALLDAAFQSVGALLGQRAEFQGLAPLPTGVDELRLFASAGPRLQVRAQIEAAPAEGNSERSSERKIVASLTLHDAKGQPVAAIRGLHLAMISIDSLLDLPQFHQPQYLGTEWIAPPAVATPGSSNGQPWLLLADAGTAHPMRTVLEASCTSLASFGAGAAQMAEIGHAIARNADALRKAPGLIVCLRPDQANDDPLQRGLALCRELQQLLLALGKVNGLPGGFTLLVLTHAAIAQTGDEQISLAQAAVAAMLRSAALEMPALRLIQIDLAQDLAPGDLPLLQHTLAQVVPGTQESQLAIRQGVVSVPRARALQLAPHSAPPAMRRDASYLITGGTGGIGLGLAHWLAQAGAGRIVLVSRSAKVNPQVAKLINHWQPQGVEIVLHAADVGQESAVADLCADLAFASKPLRGVFHAAGVLQDRPLADIDDAAWQVVMQAKARAAVLLDLHTRTIALDHFVLFSSIAGSFGSAGQCNYAAANGMLDALAHSRKLAGRCATSINWGPWGEIGMASDPALALRLARQGLLALAPDAAFKAMGLALASGQTQTAIAAIDWSLFPASMNLPHPPSLLIDLAQAAPAELAAVAMVSAETLASMAPDEARLAIRQNLAQLLKQVLRMTQASVLDETDPGQVLLSSLGIDSLLAMELRNRVRGWVNADLPAHLLIGNNTLEVVSDLIYQKVLLGYLSNSAASDAGANADDEEFVL